MKNLALVGCGDVAFRTYIPGIQAVAGTAAPHRHIGERGGEPAVRHFIRTCFSVG